MIIKILHYAKPYERFTQDSFNESIGQSFIAKVEEKPVGTGKLLNAIVTEDGRAVELEIDWPDNSSLRLFSFVTPTEENL